MKVHKIPMVVVGAKSTYAHDRPRFNSIHRGMFNRKATNIQHSQCDTTHDRKNYENSVTKRKQKKSPLFPPFPKDVWLH